MLLDIQLSIEGSLTVHQLQSEDEVIFHVIQIIVIASPVQECFGKMISQHTSTNLHTKSEAFQNEPLTGHKHTLLARQWEDVQHPGYK